VREAWHYAEKWLPRAAFGGEESEALGQRDVAGQRARRFKAAVKSGSLPPPLWLVVTVIGTLVAMAALTVVPARIGSMQSIVEVLQSEAA
jgi:hypothetical protein